MLGSKVEWALYRAGRPWWRKSASGRAVVMHMCDTNTRNYQYYHTLLCPHPSSPDQLWAATEKKKMSVVLGPLRDKLICTSSVWVTLERVYVWTKFTSRPVRWSLSSINLAWLGSEYLWECVCVCVAAVNAQWCGHWRKLRVPERLRSEIIRIKARGNYRALTGLLARASAGEREAW